MCSHFPTRKYCHTHKCTVNLHCGSCSLTSEISMEFCHVMKITVAKTNSDMRLISRQTFCFLSRRSVKIQNHIPLRQRQLPPIGALFNDYFYFHNFHLYVMTIPNLSLNCFKCTSISCDSVTCCLG